MNGISALLVLGLASAHDDRNDPSLDLRFDGHRGQVEVGGRYVGAEFHDSRPLPSRISFYYPVANSVDLSTGYWNRSASLPLAIGIRVGQGARRHLGLEPWTYSLSPHRVSFFRTDDSLDCLVSYEFCLNEPAMVMRVRVRNRLGTAVPIEVYTHLKIGLRTCHTYSRKDSARMDFDSTLSMITAQFDEPQTQNVSIFVQNVGARPAAWFSDAEEISATDAGGSYWFDAIRRAPSASTRVNHRTSAAAAFVYLKTLLPGDSLNVIEIVGSSVRGDVRGRAIRLLNGWKSEVEAFDSLVRQKALQDPFVVPNDRSVMNSATWARATLAANEHYLKGQIVPMPCPAEYNFFFTHDLLLTDLGAVLFDVPRVKRDLLYVASLSRDSIIPHAYYWKDDGYKTEYCTPDNWNHMWFILLVGSYLRHSFDRETGLLLYPLVAKSLQEVLTQRKNDNLMYAFRPDWWDIGRREGPRAYTTILTIKALREYTFISSFLGEHARDLIQCEKLANDMQEALQDRLWDDRAGYLINYNDGEKDTHYYMGSLTAVVFDLLQQDRARRLVQTVSVKLRDYRLGIRNVQPTDFHTDSMRAYFRLAGNEAGDAYSYINGGVWPHANAWYALALRSTGHLGEAYEFFTSTMTIQGITNSPMGHPAMYEYRYANSSSPEWGKIDKPSFLWAAGFYMYTLYHLFGVYENEWNVSLRGPLPPDQDSACFSLTFGNLKRVCVKGSGPWMKSFALQGRDFSSMVFPLSARGEYCTIELGSNTRPTLESINAIVHDVQFDEKNQTLHIETSSFDGHSTVAFVVSPSRVKSITVDGRSCPAAQTNLGDGSMMRINFSYVGSRNRQLVKMLF